MHFRSVSTCSCPIADTPGNSNTHGGSNSDADTQSNHDADSDSQPYTYARSYACGHGNATAHPRTDCCSDPNAEGDANYYSTAYPNGYSSPPGHY